MKIFHGALGKASEGEDALWLGHPGFKGLSGSALKGLAAIFMLLDHVGAVILERGLLKAWDKQLMWQVVSTDFGRGIWYLDRVLRHMGRLAFPIFAFCLAEGFCHTRHRRAYGLRLFLFAILSEVVFDLAVFDVWYYPQHQNVYFTLLIAYLSLWGMEKFQKKGWLSAAIGAAGCVSAYFLKTDYGAPGVMTVILLYLLRGQSAQLWAGAVFSALDSMSNTFGFAALAYIPLAYYNKKRGSWPGKYFFYWFYPVHLLCLYVIRVLMV